MKRTWYAMAKANEAEATISIHEEIGAWGIRASQFIRDLRALGDVEHIQLSVHSPGGDVFDGIAIYNALTQHPAVVTARVEGLAASMASVIVMAADEIQIPDNAMIMIHNPWSLAMGDSDAMRKEADLLDKIKGTLVSAYASKRGLDEETVAAWMDAETWFTGAEAVAAGLADTLLEEKKLAAMADLPEWLGRFVHAPHLTPEGTAMSEATQKRWWDIIGNRTDSGLQARISELQAVIVAKDDEISKLKEEAGKTDEALEKAGETIEAQEEQIEELKEAVVEAKKSAELKALEIAAAQGVPAREAPVAQAELPAEGTDTPEALKAEWAAMEPGPAKREFFAKHKARIMVAK